MSATPGSSDSTSHSLRGPRFTGAQFPVLMGICVATIVIRLVDTSVPNLGTMAALSLLTGTALRHPSGFLLPLAVRVLTDSLLHWKTGYGFFPSWPFDYSAYVLIYFVGFLLPARFGSSSNIIRHVLSLVGCACGSVAIYFLLSNFGVWLIWPQTYPHTMAGLLDCFQKAIPFARGTLWGNLVAAPVFYGLWYFAAVPVPTAVAAQAEEQSSAG